MSPGPALPMDGIGDLWEHGSRLTYAKGELVMRGESPSGVCRVGAGYVKAYTISGSGSESLHIIHGPGMVFPLAWAMSGRSRQIFYEAMGPVVLRRISRSRFQDAVRRDPAAAAAAASFLAEMLEAYADRVDNLGRTRARDRVIGRLLTLARRFGTPAAAGTVIEAPVSHADIAYSVNLSRETASRAIEQLERQGLVAYHGRRIVLPDPARLERELDAG